LGGGNQTGTVEIVIGGGPDGADDDHLQTQVEEFHVGVKNTSAWSGNYLEAGVTAIEMDLNHLLPITPMQPIQIRILIFGDGGTFASERRTPILATGEWTHHRFGLTSDDLIYLEGGTGVLEDTLGNVTTLLIRNDTEVPTPPRTHPPHVTATLGIDNIQAISEPVPDNTCDTVPPATSSLPIETNLRIANPASNTQQQSFIRFINDIDASTSVEMYGTDDLGQYSRAIDFVLLAHASKQFTAQDLEAGSAAKGLNGNFCDGQGKWQLAIFSDNPISVMGLVRTSDGFLTSLNDVVPSAGNDSLVYFSNPASNTSQQTFLRIVNLADNEGTVTISGVDDAGSTSTGTVSFSLGANQSKQITAQDIENGNVSKGLTGSLENGTGKWRLTVSSSLNLEVMSLIRSEDGFLTNLGGMVDEDGSGDHVIYFANPASDPLQQTFPRIINTGDGSDTVTISAIDDNGAIAPNGDVTFALGPNESKQVTSQDLENGNASKGLNGTLGDGTGRWRLTVSSELDLEVTSLVRTQDGFLTNLSRTSPVNADVNDVFIFNPASNNVQRSLLRVVNTSDQQGSVTITGFDDNGDPAPGGEITLNISALAAMSITAQDLENGNSDLGLVGSLGNGSGKWYLQIQSNVDLKVQSLLDTDTGFLTNLSRASE
jgi:hypothetical protein